MRFLSCVAFVVDIVVFRTVLVTYSLDSSLFSGSWSWREWGGDDDEEEMPFVHWLYFSILLILFWKIKPSCSLNGTTIRNLKQWTYFFVSVILTGKSYARVLQKCTKLRSCYRLLHRTTFSKWTLDNSVVTTHMQMVFGRLAIRIFTFDIQVSQSKSTVPTPNGAKWSFFAPILLFNST